MTERFDPYYKWLGIAPKDQPPNHYRLLGIDLFEEDGEVIAFAAKRQAKHLRTFRTAQLTPLVQKLLDEVHAAFTCLSDPNIKRTYDEYLREETKAAVSATAPSTKDKPTTAATDELDFIDSPMLRKKA